MHCPFEFCRRDGFETHFFRKELADETVHVLVRTTFPRGIGMGEEEVRAEFLGDSLMLGELLTVIRRHRVHVGFKRRQ